MCRTADVPYAAIDSAHISAFRGRGGGVVSLLVTLHVRFVHIRPDQSW